MSDKSSVSESADGSKGSGDNDKSASNEEDKSKKNSSQRSGSRSGSGSRSPSESGSEGNKKNKKKGKKGKDSPERSEKGSDESDDDGDEDHSDPEEDGKENSQDSEDENDGDSKGSQDSGSLKDQKLSASKLSGEDSNRQGKVGLEHANEKLRRDDGRSMSLDGVQAKLREIEKFISSNKNQMSVDDKDLLWKDDDFLPIAKSLAIDEEKYKDIVNKSTGTKGIKWCRPQSISKDAKFTATEFSKCDMKFGYLSDAVFTGALALLAIHPTIENLFADVDHMLDVGYCIFRFFKNGEWRYVIVDTFLPYSAEKKSFLYSECTEQNEFWVPLVEKAYAKLNGSYQNIQGMDICEVLVDLTGGVAEREEIDAEKYKEAKDSKDNPETLALHNKIISFLKNKYILGCIKHVKDKSATAKDNGDRGIYENHYYGIMGLWEFSQGSDEPRRLIKIRNYWGVEGNWNGDWCNNHEDWDRNPEIRKALLPDQKNKIKDDHIQFFMKLTDWAKELNCWYICKVFNDNWQKYSIPGKWEGKTAGGPYPDLKKNFGTTDNFPKFVMMDTDDKWFNNPQYRIIVSKKTTTIISLMQEDTRGVDGGNKYVQTNFMVVKCNGRNSRIWVMPEEKNIIVDASKTKDVKAMIEKGVIKREITCKIDLLPFEGKNYGYYIIIPFTMEEASQKKAATRRLFWLRIFTSEQTTVEPVKETLMIEEKGEWTETKHCGPMYFKLPPKQGSKDDKMKLRFNPYWCQNPQYLLNIKQPTHMKIILRKDKEMNKKKDKINVGLSICKHFEKKQETVDAHKPVNARSTVIPDPMVKLLKQTDEHLTPPVLEKIERKLLVGEHEDYYESTFGNQELAGLYFHFLPIHGPFVIMPCLSEKSKNNNYTLRIYSDKEIELVKLDETKNVCLVGAWESATSGGCDLFTEKFYKTNEFQSWTKNPKYLLNFENETYPTRLKVTLAIADKNWRGKVAITMKERKEKEAEARREMAASANAKKVKVEEEDNNNVSVATMISIYILRKSATGVLSTEDIITKAPFSPTLQTELEVVLDGEKYRGSEFIIMPTTYYRGIEGQFLISVTADKKFTFK